jgi:hypothetical protein
MSRFPADLSVHLGSGHLGEKHLDRELWQVSLAYRPPMNT